MVGFLAFNQVLKVNFCCSKQEFNKTHGSGYDLSDLILEDALYNELWHACAGPLVTVPIEGERVFYFRQGHIEQVEASTNQVADKQMPLYDLPSKILCRVINVLLKAEPDTDEVFAQVTLLPEQNISLQDENTAEKEPAPPLPSRPHVHSFYKTLTASESNITRLKNKDVQLGSDRLLGLLSVPDSRKVDLKFHFCDLQWRSRERRRGFGSIEGMKRALKCKIYGFSWVVLVGIVMIFKIFTFSPKTSTNFPLMMRFIQGVTSIGLITAPCLVVYFTDISIPDLFAIIVAFIPTGWGILCLPITWRRVVKSLGLWESVREFSRLYDSGMGMIIFVPVAVLSWFPFISTFQSRILFNQAFSRGLEISLILAGNKANICTRLTLHVDAMDVRVVTVL